MNPTPVAAIHGRAGGPLRPIAQDCAAPRMVPVIRPPISAAVRLSTAPTTRMAANPPSGKPRNDTIQRAVVRSVDVRVVAADGAIVTSDTDTPTGEGGWAGWNGGIGRRSRPRGCCPGNLK